jgi:cobalt/nickel transport system ATP-binding protein
LNDVVFKLENAGFDYPDGNPALNDVNLCITTGESVAVLGANGCGKSTLFKVLSGLLFIQKGSFHAFGHKIDNKSFGRPDVVLNYHRRVGFIFQDSDAQLFCSTIRDEIAFGPLQLGMPAQEVKRRIADISQMLGISHLLDKPPFHLSGGEKKKAALAAVLATSPDVLLLDEPANSLDPRTQRWLSGMLRELSRAGKTIVISTHSLELVSELCSRAILFNEEHTIAADAGAQKILSDTDLLKSVNLI